MFALIVDNFTIQYVGNAHLDHLCQALKKHHEVSEEIDGTCFAGMTLKWNYSPIFGQTTQLTLVNPYSPPLSTEGVKRIQGIIGTLLYYAHAVDIKLVATLSTLSSQQATATEATNVAMNQLLDFLAMYPDNGTTYCASNMVLYAHTNTGFHNESKGCS
jgi:hypothetical protein